MIDIEMIPATNQETIPLSEQISTLDEVKHVVVRAWRERWTEHEWSHFIKKLMRNFSGNLNGLADFILNQAICGPITNSSLMLYLDNCLEMNIIQFKYCALICTKMFDLKSHCTFSLLNFYDRHKMRIHSRAQDECFEWCEILVLSVFWLGKIIANSLTEMNEILSSNEYQGSTLQNCNNQYPAINLFHSENIHYRIVEKSINLLRYISNSSYLQSLLYIGRLEKTTEWNEWNQIQIEINSIFKSMMVNSSCNNDKNGFEKIINDLREIAIQFNEFNKQENRQNFFAVQPRPHSSKFIFESPFKNFKQNSLINYKSIRILITFYAMQDLSTSNALLADYLMMIKKSFDLDTSRLYCEILHTCFIGLIDAHKTANEDRKNINHHAWTAFLLFRVPSIFLHISKLIKVENHTVSKIQLETDLLLGIEKLIKLGPCIDQLILCYDIELVKKFLECLKDPAIDLLTSEAIDRLLKEIKLRISTYSDDTTEAAAAKPQDHTSNGCNVSSSDSLSCNILIYRAEHSVKSILTPLYMDTCNIEAVAGIICKMQHSFDLILCAAASNELLSKFAQRLIELNVSNSKSSDENLRSSQIRAIVFDITFVSLCSLVERYGLRPIYGEQKNTSTYSNDPSFFIRWCRLNITSSESVYDPSIILSSYPLDSEFEDLLTQYMTSDANFEFKTASVNWEKMCVAIQFATAELLDAWTHNIIDQEEVMKFIKRLKNPLCFLAFSSGCWLIAKMKTVSADRKTKIMFILNELQQSPEIDQIVETFFNEADYNNLYFGFKQRWTLMSSTLKRLMTRYSSSIQIITDPMKPILKASKSSLNASLDHGLHITRNHFSLKQMNEFCNLISLGGPRWFVDRVVDHVLSFNDIACLQDGVDLAYGLFHFDLQQCTLALLKHILPSFLLSKSSELELIEPKISALFRLTICTVYSAIQLSKKRPKMSQIEILEGFNSSLFYGNHQKNLTSKLDLISNSSLFFKIQNLKNYRLQNVNQVMENNERDDFDSLICLQNESNESDILLSNYDHILNEPLYFELVNIFRFILDKSFQHEISPWLLVFVILLEQIHSNLQENSAEFLQLLPLNFFETMIESSYYQVISYEQLLNYLVLDSSESRKIASKLVCHLYLKKRPINQNVKTAH